MIVTFCGHSKIYQTCEISKWLDIILPSLIEGGAATFYLGGYGDFDSLAAAAVRRQKATYHRLCGESRKNGRRQADLQLPM